MTIRICSLASGSSGNCIYVGCDDGGILVDCGISGKQILGRLHDIGICQSTIKAIFVTHEHSDHIKCIGVISRKLNIPIYANNNTWNEMSNSIGKIATCNIKVFETAKELLVSGLSIKSFEIPHDAVAPVGYCFYRNGSKVSIATDIGYMSDEVFSNISGSDFLLLESNHDIEMLKMGSYPYYLKQRILSNRGHLSNEAAGQALIDLYKSGVKKVLLGHLSRENNFPELAFETVKSVLQNNNLCIGEDIDIDIAPRSSVSRLFHICQEA